MFLKIRNTWAVRRNRSRILGIELAVQIFNSVTDTNISYFWRIWNIFQRHRCCMFARFLFNRSSFSFDFLGWQVLSECVPVPVERGAVHLAAGIRQIGPASGTERRARKWHQYHPIHWHAQHDGQQLGRVVIHPNIRGKYSWQGSDFKTPYSTDMTSYLRSPSIHGCSLPCPEILDLPKNNESIFCHRWRLKSPSTCRPRHGQQSSSSSSCWSSSSVAGCFPRATWLVSSSLNCCSSTLVQQPTSSNFSTPLRFVSLLRGSSWCLF